MRLRNLAKVTNTKTIRVTPNGPASPYAIDATVLTDRTASWHVDVMIRTPTAIVAGYSKTSGKYGIAEFDPNTGVVIDSRVIVDEPTLYTSINDHFMVIPWRVHNGVHAGKLWAISLPHGVAISGEGGLRFFCRYSNTGRTSNLVPAGSGTDYLLASDIHNYGNIQERSDGRICLLTINDNSVPQTGRMLYTDDPSVIPTLCRPIFDMSSIPSGGDPQIYANAVPGVDADTMRVYLFLHPSVPDAPIRTCLLNLSDGTCRVGGVAQGSGSIFDTSGATMLSYGIAPAINAPTGSMFTRVHDVCQYGDYQHGYAIALTQGTVGSDLDAPSHIVRWCTIGQNVEDSANWQQVNIGDANRARSWDNGGNRRYNSDIRFLPPVGDEAIRVWLIAYESGFYRVEIWSGSAPNTMNRKYASEWSDAPRPMRLFTNPGARQDAIVGFIYGFDSYTSFSNFVPGDPSLVSYAVPSVVTNPVISGVPNIDQVYYVASPATFTGTPMITYQWRISDNSDGSSPSNIIGATSETYTPQAGDSGKYLQRQDIATSERGVVVGSSNWSSAVVSQPLWSPSNLPAGLVAEFFDPAVGTTLVGSDVSEWTGSGSTVYSQTNSAERPSYNSSPSFISFAPTTASTGDQFLSGDAVGVDFFRNRGLVYSLIIVRPTALGTSTRAWKNHSNGSAATAARMLIRSTTDRKWQLVLRRLDADPISSIVGTDAVIDTDVMLEALGVFSSSGSTARFFVNTVQQPNPTTEPTSGAATSNTASLADRLGTDGTGGSNAAGRLYVAARVYGSSGVTMSQSDQQKLQGWAAHKFGFVSLLPSDHPHKSSAPTV